MLKFFQWVFWTVVVVIVTSLALGTLILGNAWDGLQAGQWHVIVDGETLADEALLGEALTGGGAVLAALITGLLTLILVPLVLFVGVGLPLLLVLLALGAVALGLLGGALVVLAPLAIPVLLIVWLARRQSRPTVAR